MSKPPDPADRPAANPELQAQLAALDRRLLLLLNERSELSAQLDPHHLLSLAAEPQLERDVVDRLAAMNPGPVRTATLRAIYREILSAELAQHAPTSVAYLGPEATYTHQACLRRFGHAVACEAKPTIHAVFEAVERGHATFGVVPIENSTEGAVTVTFDLFADADLTICGEVCLPIRHHLLSRETDLAAIATVFSHSQSLAQCRAWLATNLPHATLEACTSNALAVTRSLETPKSASIAGALAAETYGIPILKEAINDLAANMTRFLVLSKGPAPRTGKDKTSIMFAIKDRVGALYDALLPFKVNGVNMTMIQSRPSKRKTWDYHFFVDFTGHAEDRQNAAALAGLKEHCTFLKVLGSYPVADPA